MSDSTLTELQRLVLELFFMLPESDSFVLTGGAALVASGLSTQDVLAGDVVVRVRVPLLDSLGE